MTLPKLLPYFALLAIATTSFAKPAKQANQAKQAKPEDSCELVAIGHMKVIPNVGPAYNLEVSPDQKSMTASLGHGILIQDLETGRKKETSFPDGTLITANHFTRDGKKLVTVTTNNKDSRHSTIRIQDPKRLQSPGVALKVSGPILQQSMVINENQFVAIAAYAPAKPLKSDEGRINFRRELSADPNSKEDSRPSLILRDLKTKKGREIKFSAPDPIDAYSASVILSPDNKAAIISAREFGQSFIVMDLVTGKQKTLESASTFEKLSFSPDGKKVVLKNYGNEQYKAVDIRTGNSEVYTPTTPPAPPNPNSAPPANGYSGGGMGYGFPGINPFNNANFSPPSDTKKDIALRSGQFETRITNTKTGQSYTLPIIFDSEAKLTSDGKVAYGKKAGSLVLFPLDTTCTDPTLRIENPAQTKGDCPDANGAANPIAAVKPLQNLLMNQACSEPFNEKLWDQITPLNKQNPIPLKAAKDFLMRFQKPGGFDPKKHTAILTAILNSDLANTSPALIRGAMRSVLHSSNTLYQKLMANNGVNVAIFYTPDVIKNQDWNLPCKTPEDEAHFAKDAKKFLVDQAGVLSDKATLESWRGLAPLTSYLSQLSAADKENYTDIIAQSLANDATESSVFKRAGVGTSNLYKFTFEAAKPFFGESPHLLTHLTYGQSPGRSSEVEVRPIILGTAPLEIFENNAQSTLDTHGIFYTELPVEKIREEAPPNTTVVDRNYAWRINNQNFNSHITATKVPQALVLPTGKGPNYEELWKGEKPGETNLSGLVIAGQNLGADLAKSTIDQYFNYYLKQGFEFESEEPEVTTGLRDKIGKWISSGETKYLVREAHLGGDDVNFVGISNTGLVYTAKKTHPDGKVETIRLVYPGPTNNDTVMIATDEFGKWIRERETNGKSQLVVLNTGCWSADIAARQIAAVHSSKMVLIPTISEGLTFSNDKDDAIYAMIHGIRNNADYDGIRANLSLNQEYVDRQARGKYGHNWYILPDEDDYKRVITNTLRVPVAVNVETQDGALEGYMMGHSFGRTPAATATPPPPR